MTDPVESLAQRVAERVLDLVVNALDVNALMQRVDLNAVLDQVDVEAVRSQVVGVDGFIDRWAWRLRFLARQGQAGGRPGGQAGAPDPTTRP
jgi:hypothetical protein